MNIPRLGYLVSAISYLIFLTLDWLRPGFVSNFLSPHLFLLAAIIFGIFYWRQSPKKISFNFLLFPLSFLLALFTWKEGRAFEDYRLLVTLIAFVVPWMVGRSMANGQ